VEFIVNFKTRDVGILDAERHTRYSQHSSFLSRNIVDKPHEITSGSSLEYVCTMTRGQSRIVKPGPYDAVTVESGNRDLGEETSRSCYVPVRFNSDPIVLLHVRCCQSPYLLFITPAPIAFRIAGAELPDGEVENLWDHRHSPTGYHIAGPTMLVRTGVMGHLDRNYLGIRCLYNTREPSFSYVCRTSTLSVK
jgi:hypothetical protein